MDDRRGHTGAVSAAASVALIAGSIGFAAFSVAPAAITITDDVLNQQVIDAQGRSVDSYE